MVKSLDSNQLQKIDRRFNRPLYLVHITILWQYKGDYLYGSSAACTGNKIISNQYSDDHWLTAGILPGDLFKFDDTGSWIAVDTIDTDLQVTLVSDGPIWEGGPYTFKREVYLYWSDRNFFYNNHNYEDYFFDLSGIGNQIRNLGGYDNTEVKFRCKNQKIRDKNTLIEFFDENPPEDQTVEIYVLYKDPGETLGSDVSTKLFKGMLGEPHDVDEIEFGIDAHSMLFSLNDKLPIDVIDLDDFPGADPDDVGKARNIPIGNIKKLICPWTDAGWVSTLTGAIGPSTTSFQVTDATNSPSTPFTTICDNEKIRITLKVGNTFTATRGYGGTTAISHSTGATIYEEKTNFEAEVSMYAIKSIGDIYVKRGSSEWTRLLSGFTKYASSGGRAYIRFTDKPKFEQGSSDLDVELTDEPHAHPLQSPETKITKKCIPSGATGGTNPTYAIDGHEDSYAAITYGQTLQCTFTETSGGTITHQYVWIYNHLAAVSGNVKLGTVLIGTLPAQTGWFRFGLNGGSWNASVSIQAGAAGNNIGEVYKEVEYIADPVTMSANLLEPYLTGNSVANMMIGDVVACDVEGIPDDGSGTYTGTPSALIERPDHFRKYGLMGLLGVDAGDIDSSFATIGAIYAARISGGYKLSFNLPDVAREAIELFRKIDFETRSNMFESAGKFKLAFNSTDEPTSQITFTKDNIVGRFKFGKTDIADVKHILIGHYFRDYAKTGSPGEIYQKVLKKSVRGDKKEEIEFACIGDLETMVSDVMDWLLLEKKVPRKTVFVPAKWEAEILEHCDYFTVVSTFWTGLKWKTIGRVENPENQTIELTGLEFKSS